MGKLQNFAIRYDNYSNGVYFGGQTISGRVFLVLNEPMKMRGLRLHVNGKAHTQWTESRTRTHRDSSGHTRTETYYVTYSANEVYLDAIITLWGKPPGVSGEDPVMPVGSYEFPFSCTIPQTCPSSFEGQHGYIRYNCKAVIDRPWRFDHKCLVPFTLVGLVDLNHEPTALCPIQDFKDKELGCCCCVSGTLQCTVNVPRSGFVPGESIPLNIEVHNNSTTEVTEVTVTLMENVVFRAEGHTRFSSRTVASLDDGAIEGGKSQIWSGKSLVVPPVAPTIKHCSIIDASYELQIKANPSGCHSSLKLFFPILIGNVPLRQVYQNASRVITAQPLPMPSAPSADSAEPSAPPPGYGEYPDLPPPSYEEAMFGGGNVQEDEDEHTSGPTNYAPRYPYYNWLSKKA